MPALLVVLALLVISAARLEQRTTTRTLVVRGTVTDSSSHAALEGAQVWINYRDGAPAVLLTGRDGRYLATVTVSDTRSTIVVRARRLGYASGERSIPTRGDTLTVDLALMPASMELLGGWSSPARATARAAP